MCEVWEGVDRSMFGGVCDGREWVDLCGGMEWIDLCGEKTTYSSE